MIGASMQSRSANRAAQATTDAANQNNQTQLQIYNQQRADAEPWRQFGLGALGQLSQLYNLGWQPPQTMQGGSWGNYQTGGGAPPTNQPNSGNGTGLSPGWQGGGQGFLSRYTQPGQPEAPQIVSPVTQDITLGDGDPRSRVQPGTPINALAAPIEGPQVNGGPNGKSVIGVDQPIVSPTLTQQPQVNGGPNGGVDQPLVNGGPGNGYTPTTSTGGTLQPGQPGLNYQPFYASPDYQFRLNEGNRNLTNAFANTGNLDSGAAQRALLRYGQDTASGEWNNYVNRLASFAGVGQTVNQNNNALATNYANNVQQNNWNAAQGRASAYQQQGQAWQQGLGTVAGAGMWAINNWGAR